MACVSADDFRWKKAHIKSVSLAGSVLARQMSADVGAAETVMFRDGFLSEGAAANVWVVKDGRVIGAPKDNLVLEGIRYGLLEELCMEADIPFELRPRGAGRGVRGRRTAAFQRQQGSAAGHPPGRAGYWKRQARPYLREVVRRLSACEAHPLAMTIPSSKDSLIEYPSRFPIKVMGANVDGFVHAVTMIARQFDPAFDAASVELRDSKAGNYLGVTITVTVVSREQLDELYRTLSTHPMVKVVL